MTLRATALCAVLIASACARDPARPGGAAAQDLRVPELRKVDAPPNLGETAYRHVERLCEFGARHTGSPGWERALDYIAHQCARLGLRPQRDRWTDPREQLTFENIRVTIPGRRRDKIVIGAHHDTKNTSGHEDPEHNFDFVGANDSGSGVGLLLALAGVLKERADTAAATIELVFFDGEESVPFDWDPDRSLFGSKRYVQQYQERRKARSDEPPIAAFILLDMVGSKDLTIDDEENSDVLLRRIFRRAAEACGHQRYFFRYEQKVKDDHLPFLAAGIPAIDLIDIADNPHWHTPDDTLEHISARSMQIVGEVVLTALPEVERRYVVAAEDRPADLKVPDKRR